MSWSPILGSMFQYSKEAAASSVPASGYVLKLYNASNVAIQMASTRTGSGLLSDCVLDSSGYPVNGSSDRFSPFIDQEYKVALYSTQALADADTTGSADFFIGPFDVAISASDGAQYIDTVTDATAETLGVGSSIQTLGRLTVGDGGAGLYQVVAFGTGIDDGGAFIDADDNSFQLKLITSRPNMIQWGCVAGGVTDNLTQLQAFFDAQTGKCYGSKGVFLVSDVVTWPRYTDFEGAGQASETNTLGTNFFYSGTGECFRSAETINGSTAVHLKVSGFRIRKTVQASTKGAIAQIAGTHVDMSNIRIDTSSGAFSFDYGLVLDQTEICNLTQITISGMTIANYWLVNGADYTATGLTNFTNDITMRNCSSNGSAIGIQHDGGSGFKVIGGNTNNASTAGMRLSGLNQFSIDSTFMEGGSGTADILIEQTTAAGASIGAGANGAITNCRLASSATNCIRFNNPSIPIAGCNIFGNFFGSARAGSAISVAAADSLINSTVGPNTNSGGAGKLYLDADVYLSNSIIGVPTGSQSEARQTTIMPGGMFWTTGSGRKTNVTFLNATTLADYTVLDTDHHINVQNNSGVDLPIILPSGSDQDGRTLTFTLTVGTSSVSIASLAILNQPGDNITIRYDHTNAEWQIIACENENIITVSGAGAINPLIKNIHLITTGANALTLADGSNGQEMWIVMKTDGGAGTLTPANLGNGTTITFDDVGDSAYLKFTNSAWHFFGGTATLA